MNKSTFKTLAIFTISSLVLPSAFAGLESPMWFSASVGDKVSYYDNRLGASNGYGLGIESGTLYFKSSEVYRWYIGANANGGSSSKMTLSNSLLYIKDSVGIGTTSTSYKLSVNGTIRAKEVIVDTGWSDYVFDDDYPLASLSEVEAHIKEKRHLPGIPSAREVEKEGVSLGEMQSVLLAKIEELTLYQIAMQKRLDSQAAKIIELSTALATSQRSE